MLTVEIRDAQRASSGGAEVEIYCDAEGLDFLIEKLKKLQQSGGHHHFMTPAWAGHGLNENQNGSGTDLVHHLCVAVAKE